MTFIFFYYFCNLIYTCNCKYIYTYISECKYIDYSINNKEKYRKF
ncbi:hypothetical protein HMPREF1154_2111 [Capnocytophaga sp. CM59]|nr:hypothetical protein HMPREF1154_2111 [Capnocytophaga sp. CM59]